MAACLTAVFTLFNPLQASAASAGAKSHSTPTNHSKAATSGAGVPENCIRQACGSLWCWKMKGQTR
jgi:hypothetical protein